MSKLNNENIKDLLSKTTVEFDLDLEWGGIASKMDKKKRDRKGFWWIIGVLLLGLCTAIFWNTLDGDQSKSKYANEVASSNESVDMGNKHFEDVDNSLVIKNSKTTSETELQSKNNSEQTIKTTAVLTTPNAISDFVQSTEKPNSKRVDAQNEEIKAGIVDQHNSSFDYQNKTSFIGDQNSIVHVLEVREDNEAQNILDQISEDKNRIALVELIEIGSVKSGIILQPRDVENPSFASIELIKPQSFLKDYIYADIAISTANINVERTDNNSFEKILLNDYRAITKLESGIGMGRYITPKWRVNIGIGYDQHRSVYRGQIIRQEISSMQNDSASVFVNSISGNVYKEGDIIRTTTTIADIQQYNYIHQIGLNIGSRYNFYGPFYAGADIHWLPIQWQSGQMLNSSEVLAPFNDLDANTRKFNLGLDLGLNFKLANHINIDAGIRYQPSQFLISLDQVNLNNQTFGGQIRSMYGF